MQYILRNNLRVFLLLALVCFAVYGIVIPGKFVFDDNLFIENNEQIKSLSQIPNLYFSSVTEGSNVAKDNFYRPNQQALYAIIYSLFGLNPAPFHIASIFFHSINSFLIFLLFMQFGIQRTTAFATALIFLIHPINTQAVCYISGMADPLGMMFILSALQCFVRFSSTTETIEVRQPLIGSKSNAHLVNRHGLRAWVPNKTFLASLSMLFFVAGLLSKENTVVFPALACLSLIIIHYPFNPLAKTGGKTILSNTRISLSLWLIIVYFLMAGIYLYLKFTVLNFSGNLGLTDQQNIYTESLHIRLITFINILPEYFIMILYPVRLNYEKPYTAFVDFYRPEAVAGLIIILMLIGITIYAIARLHPKKNNEKNVAPYLTFFSFGGLWFFICMAPVSGIIPVNAMYLEHWLYFPLIGILYACAKTYDTFRPGAKYVFSILFILIGITFAIRTVIRNAEWADPVKFYKNELKYSPESARIHNNLAMVYADEKKCPLAIRHYKKAIELYDVYPQTHHNLARCHENMGNYNEAINEYFNALLIYPNFTHSHKYLVHLFAGMNDSLHAAPFRQFLERIEHGETIAKEEIINTIENLKK